MHACATDLGDVGCAQGVAHHGHLDDHHEPHAEPVEQEHGTSEERDEDEGHELAEDELQAALPPRVLVVEEHLVCAWCVSVSAIVCGSNVTVTSHVLFMYVFFYVLFTYVTRV